MKVITILFLAVIATSSATELKCEFNQNVVFRYVCEIKKVQLINEKDEITIEHGNHVKGKTDFTDNDVKMVSFMESTVKVLPKTFFAIFPNLEIFDLMNVKMKTWNRDYLKNAKNLKRIWLAQNEIEELGDNSFMGAITLEILLLHNNKITKISDKAFNGLLQLKSLELQNNLMKTLAGNCFAPLKKLKELNLSENQIAKIDGKVFESNTKLEFLNMAINNITFLPETVFKMQPNLTVVYLQNNQIEKLSANLFTACSSLMELRLDNNEIKEIPKGIFTSNKKFKLLNIMSNLIETFDGQVLPEGMELLYLDEAVTTQHMPEKLEIFRAEKNDPTHWTEPETTQEFTTADK